MITENDALSRLSIWLKQYGWIVYQDKKNKLDNQIFHVKGESKKKPDLITIKGNYIIAVEVKSGSNSRDLGVYSKTSEYFKNYNEDKTFYFDYNNNIICISDFVIGTYFSPDGHLYYKETLRECSERHLGAYRRNLNPKNEYGATFQIVRRGMWDHIDYDKYRKYSTGIGALLSTTLDGKENRPATFIMASHNIQPKRKWWHTWKTF